MNRCAKSINILEREEQEIGEERSMVEERSKAPQRRGKKRNERDIWWEKHIRLAKGASMPASTKVSYVF